MNKKDIEQVTSSFKEKLLKIKVALFDVDGVLTDGRIYYSGNEIGFNRFFHTHDGYGLKMLMKAGLKVGVISGGDSEGVKQRFNLLGLDYIYLGNEDKRNALKSILEETKLSPENILYMGDEFFDLPLLKEVGFSATTPDASFEIQESVDYVTRKHGGKGAAREVIDLLRYVQNIVPEIPGWNS